MEPLFHLEGMAVQEIGDEDEFDDEVQTNALLGALLTGLFFAIAVAIVALALGYFSGAGLAVLLPGIVDHHTNERRLFTTPLTAWERFDKAKGKVFAWAISLWVVLWIAGAV